MHLDSVDDAGSIEVVTSRLPEPGEVRISAFLRRVPPGPFSMFVGVVSSSVCSHNLELVRVVLVEEGNRDTHAPSKSYGISAYRGTSMAS